MGYLLVGARKRYAGAAASGKGVETPIKKAAEAANVSVRIRLLSWWS
jgi:hypothetical protein